MFFHFFFKTLVHPFCTCSPHDCKHPRTPSRPCRQRAFTSVDLPRGSPNEKPSLEGEPTRFKPFKPLSPRALGAQLPSSRLTPSCGYGNFCFMRLRVLKAQCSKSKEQIWGWKLVFCSYSEKQVLRSESKNYWVSDPKIRMVSNLQRCLLENSRTCLLATSRSCPFGNTRAW